MLLFFLCDITHIKHSLRIVFIAWRFMLHRSFYCFIILSAYENIITSDSYRLCVCCNSVENSACARVFFWYVILMHAVIISWADGRVERARRVEIPPCIGKSWKRPSYKLSEPHRLHETEHIPTDTRTRRDHGHV